MFLVGAKRIFYYIKVKNTKFLEDVAYMYRHKKVIKKKTRRKPTNIYKQETEFNELVKRDL